MYPVTLPVYQSCSIVICLPVAHSLICYGLSIRSWVAALERGYLASENQMLKALSTHHPWFGLAPNLLDNDIRPHQFRAGVPHGTYNGRCNPWSQRQVTLLLGIVYETTWNTNSHCDAYSIRTTVLFQPLTS